VDTLDAVGGDGTYVWSLAAGLGALPTGLTVTSDGRIVGTTTAVGTWAFGVRVVSGDRQSSERPYTITVPPVLQPHERCRDYPVHAIATFEDPVLTQKMREAVGLDHDLTCARLAQVGRIDAIPGAGILSLRGAQNLTGLATVWAPGQSIDDVAPLAGLTGITRINLGNSRIGDISAFGTLTAVTYLAVAGNRIADIAPLAGWTLLERASLSRNLITTVPDLSGLIVLEELWLDNNDITDISGVAGLTSLRILALDSNAVSDLGPVGELTSLTGLALRSNQISDLTPLAGLTGLYSLYLSDNNITDVSALAGLTELGELYLDGNAGLSNIQALLDNPGLGGPYPPPQPLVIDTRDFVRLAGTSVSCADVAALRAKDVAVSSECP
jgi:hypothetical protein